MNTVVDDGYGWIFDTLMRDDAVVYYIWGADLNIETGQEERYLVRMKTSFAAHSSAFTCAMWCE